MNIYETDRDDINARIDVDFECEQIRLELSDETTLTLEMDFNEAVDLMGALQNAIGELPK